MNATQNQTKHQRKARNERILGMAAVVTIIAAWIIGYRMENAELEPFLHEAYPAAQTFEKLSAGTYAAYAGTNLIGYVGTGEANGYGGPMKLAVGVDLNGDVISMSIVKHRETPSWMKKVADSGYIEDLFGKSYLDPFQLNEDIDGVTSATYTSRAIAESVLAASRNVAGNQLGFEVPPQPKEKIVFGVPEITLIALFAVGYFGKQRGAKYKKQLRWASLITGMVILGFMYNSPLTLAYINKLLLGFWPGWRTGLYWYLLIGGIFFVFTVDNKNPYCQWFCPFGAAQECMGAIGQAKVLSPGRHRQWITWLRRGVVWFAIVIALLFRSPGLTSYEIFGTLFSLLGSNLQFILLAIVLLASLFIKRPWCAYLCPLGPVDEFIRMVRKWIIQQWRTINQDRKNVPTS